ncbi:hypothetical protein HIV01_001140 [Lysobacter arenosi]|uniref:DUF4222 domain-containing protein n=1 Tax=Lysobacter arenosi TaxID=2795387 RepID=A0ABX7RE25_9GAMM|nr:hypothetical protein [Lysobacter arenosi]QSX75207.1 hypothetical protein HIV01_001140 [Lysobacter arenosi]
MQNEVLLDGDSLFVKVIDGRRHVIRIGAAVGTVAFTGPEYFYDLESKYSASELRWMENRFLAHKKRMMLELAGAAAR